MPTIEAWLQGAVEDVTRASRPEVRLVLEALAQAGAALRRADWNADAARQPYLSADAARQTDKSADAEDRAAPVMLPDRRG